MRVTYRGKRIKDYWKDRWLAVSIDEPMENKGVYPLKYAELAIESKQGRILEAGCGNGRLLRYYHQMGYDIVGMDYIEEAIQALKRFDPGLKVEIGDIKNLAYQNSSFRYVLAFGLYHNLENGLKKAIRETYRVIEPGGGVCASFRADNIQTRLTDRLTDYREKKKRKMGGGTEFHKLNLTRDEFVDLFQDAGFQIQSVFPVENMPLFYKFSFFRAKSHKIFDESLGRKEGYRLSFLGDIIQRSLFRYFPDQLCNVFVLIGRKA